MDEKYDLDLDMVGLKAKILSLFSFPSDADLTLTYVDEDGDVVTLVDDNDLRDVMRQNLKFLRINVSVNSEKSGRSYARSSGSSTPLRSPQGQQPLPDVSAVVAEALKTVHGPIREAMSKLSLDLASKAASSSPTISDFIDSFTKLGQSHLNTGFQPQVGGNVGGDNGASASPGTTSVAADTDAAKDESMHSVMLNSNFGHSSSKECKDVDDGGVDEGRVVSAAPVHVPVDLNADLPGELNLSGGETKVEGHKISGGKTQGELLRDLKKLKDKISCQSGGKTKVASENISGGKVHAELLKTMNKKMNDYIKDQASRQSAAFGASTSTVHNPGYLNPHPVCIPGFTVSSFQQLLPVVNGMPVTPGLNANVEGQNVSGGKTQADVQTELQKNVNDNISSVDPGASPTVANTTAMLKPAAVGPSFEPFSGLPLADDWSFGHGAPRRPHPFKRSSNYTDAMCGIFHKGIRCDGCGVHPITGPRFKSKV